MTDDRTRWAVPVATANSFVLLVALLYRSEIQLWPRSVLEAGSAAISVAALIGLAVTSTRGMWSASWMYGLMLVLFHTSIPIAHATRATLPDEFDAYINSWYLTLYAREAVYVSTLAVLALAAAAAWVHAVRPRPSPAIPAEPVPAKFAQIGALLTAGGVLLYVEQIIITAPGLLTGGSYREYVTNIGFGSPLLGYANFAVAIGLCLAAVSGPCRERTIAWAFFCFYAVLTLAIGARTAAMFPAVAALVAAAACARRTPRARTAIATVLLGLVCVTAVQQIRSDGLSADSLSQISINPAAALAETGGSVRTVAEVIGWQRGLREPAHDGATYATPFIRIWEGLSGKASPDPDPRFAAQLLNDRYPVYQLGFSPVAEAFMNFGTAGVIVILALIGALFAAFDTRRLTHVGAAQLGVVLFALAYNIRNGSNSVYATLAIGLAVVWLASRTRLPVLPRFQRDGVRGATHQ